MTTNETPFGPLSSLVGRTFERDGMRRTVTMFVQWSAASGDIYWARPGKEPRLKPIYSGYFVDWLHGATEVKDGTDEASETSRCRGH